MSIPDGASKIFFHHRDNLAEFLASISVMSRMLGFVATLFELGPLLLGSFIMIKLSKNYVTEKIFSLQNAKFYRRLGIIYLFSALLLQPIAEMLFTLSATINNSVGQRQIAVGLHLPNITAIFFAIVLILIGHVMTLSQRISEEQALTI